MAVSVSSIILLLILTWREFGATPDIDSQHKVEKDIPVPKLSKFTGPRMKFLYWLVQHVGR